MMPHSLRWHNKLVDWYRHNRRDLPWRRTSSAYAVWVSEIMLQQTQVAVVVPYFERFMTRFPTVSALAAAPLEDVLKLWQGLGYYSRGRNLHRAAKDIVNKHCAAIPATYKELLTIPGIGPYTAAAVASIAFEEAVPVIDGNVLRVVARLDGISDNVRSANVKKRVQAKLEDAIQHAVPSEFNQAVMELGALICNPRQPDCEQCPLNLDCVAFRDDKTQSIPYRPRRGKVPHYSVAVALIWEDEKLLIARRRADQMLGGMWELPGGKRDGRESLAKTVVREVMEETGLTVEPVKRYAPVKHGYSHFSVSLYPFSCRVIDGTAHPLASSEIRWVKPEQLANFAFPRGTLKVFEKVLS